MTYPPQPPPSDPYGGAGYGQQYPGYPGYQGQQFPHRPYYGQQGPYQQQPGYGVPPGGTPPPEPPKHEGRTGLVIGLVLALLLLAGGIVGVTGFWQPGFFRTDPAHAASAERVTVSETPTTTVPKPEPKPDPTQPSEPTTQAPPSSGDRAEIRQITDTVVAGINNRDANQVKPVSCDPRKERQSDYAGFPEDLTVSASGEPIISGDAATVPLILTRSGSSKKVDLELRRVNGSWCASGVT